MVFERKVKTGIEDVGKNCNITNRAILRILEKVCGYQSDEAGYGILDIEQKGVSWILIDWKLKIIKRPKYGEELLVKTWGRNYKKISTYRDYEIYNQNNELLVIATSKWVLMDIKSKKIIRITPEIVGKYKMLEKSVFGELELEKINLINVQDYTNSIKYEVKRRDIDINGHMHNIYYLDLAYEALPEEVYENRPYNNVRISYKNEIKLGDNVSCNYANINGKHMVIIKNDSKNIINAIIELWND